MKHIQIRNSDMACILLPIFSFHQILMSQNSIRRLSASILLAVVRSRRLAISMAKHWLKKAISFSLMTPVSRENLVGSLAG